MNENENNEADEYNFFEEFHDRNLIYDKMLMDEKEEINLETFKNLSTDLHESNNSIFDTVSNISGIDIEAKEETTGNDCELNLENCNYSIIGEYNENLEHSKEMEGKSEMKKAKTDFRMRWKSVKSPYLYNDRNYAILPYIPERLKNLKNKIKMNDLFFACFCEKRYDGKRKLIINGNDLFPRIMRRFEDSDMPNLLNFLERNTDVAALSLAYNEIHCSSFIILINYLKKNDHILELNLQSNEIGETGINYLCKEPENLKLRMLRLNGNKFGVESSKKIALFLAKNSYLRHLDVAEVDQTISSLVYYTNVLRINQDECCKSLTILDISRPNPGYMHKFDSAHFSSLIGLMLKANETLLELHLQKYGFSCHDIELMLIDAKYNKTLHLLDLNENNIGDHGIEQFANWFAEKPALRGLLLSHNIVTNIGARALSFCLPFSRIRMLDLSYNRIEDEGAVDVLNSIKKSYPMRHLRLFGNNINHPTAKIVERMLISGVLVQENLDLKPYKVDEKLYLAHYPADHYKQRYYSVPLHSYPQPLKIPFVKNVFKGMAIPKVSFKYVDPVPIVQRRPKVKININHPYECVCCNCTEDQIMNSLAPSPVTSIQNICECCVCSTLENEMLKDRLEIFNSPPESRIENPDYLECFSEDDDEESKESSIGLKEIKSFNPISIKEKLELVLQQVNSKIRGKVLRWMTIDELSLEKNLKEISGTFESDSEKIIQEVENCHIIN